MVWGMGRQLFSAGMKPKRHPQSQRPTILLWSKRSILHIKFYFQLLSSILYSFWTLISVIILIRIQMVLDPYKLRVNNEWELASFNAACITLFGGLLYVSEVTRVSFVDIFAFIIILIINIYFILLWIYLFSYSLDRFKYVRKLTEFLKILLRRKDDVFNIDPPQPNSIVTENKRKPIKKLLKKPCKKKEKKRKLKIKVIFRLYNYWLNFSYSIINLLTYLYIYLSYWVWYHLY